MVVVWHVTTLKKLNRYLKSGFIKPPVRVWIDIKEAERFSKQTGRVIILRLKFPESKIKKLDGHHNRAVYLDEVYTLNNL